MAAARLRHELHGSSAAWQLQRSLGRERHAGPLGLLTPPRRAVLRCRPSAPLTQVYQLYMGERGLVFWANKAALASIVFLIVAWIAFRFLGPALGLYQLQQDFSTPNF